MLLSWAIRGAQHVPDPSLAAKSQHMETGVDMGVVHAVYPPGNLPCPSETHCRWLLVVVIASSRFPFVDSLSRAYERYGSVGLEIIQWR